MKLWYSLVAHSAVKPSIKGSLTHGGLTQKEPFFYNAVFTQRKKPQIFHWGPWAHHGTLPWERALRHNAVFSQRERGINRSFFCPWTHRGPLSRFTFSAQLLLARWREKGWPAEGIAALYTVGLQAHSGRLTLIGRLRLRNSVGESMHSMIESSTHRVQ